MTYAVIQTGGKQYKVKTSEILKIEKLENSKFCIKYDPNNKNLKNKIINIKKNIKNNLPTIPSTIKDELECNIFLRSNNLNIQTKLNFNNNNSLETFSKLRDLKDNF